MTIPTPMTPKRRSGWRDALWYGGTTILAIIIAIVMINSVGDNRNCSLSGLQITRTTVPNPLDLLTKPIPTPGAPKPTPPPGTCP